MSRPLKATIYQRWKLHYRLLCSGALAGMSAIALPAKLDWATRTLCIWDAGMLCFLALNWMVMLQATPESMRRVARSQDTGRSLLLGLITVSACASLLAIFFMLRNVKVASAYPLSLHLSLAGVTIVGGWLLVHTIFALHYAHTYYQSDDRNRDATRDDIPSANGHTSDNANANQTIHQQAGGLDFPNDWEPDYWDFVYYSFVIGMTSQVSDVQTTSRDMRRLTLLHGVLSFFFNTVIVAMSINIIAGLI